MRLSGESPFLRPFLYLVFESDLVWLMRAVFRLFFAATTVMASLHVWKTRNTNNTQAAPEMQMNV